MISRVSLHLLYLCCGIGMVSANHCYLHSECVDENSIVALSTSSQSEQMFTCLGSGIQSVSWFFTRLVNSTIPPEAVPLVLDNSRFSSAGSSAQELTIRNITGEYEAQYSCATGMQPEPMTILGCLIVQGRAYFENCNGTLEPSGSCSSDEETIVVASSQEARLDLRVVFRDGGVCENQTIRRLRVERDGVSIYNCSNILSNASQPCFSTDKYRVDNSQCPQDCVAGTELQCCKFRFFLVIMDVNVSDIGRYVASMEVLDDGSVRRDITKTFVLQMSPDPPITTPTTGSTVLIGSDSTGMTTEERGNVDPPVTTPITDPPITTPTTGSTTLIGSDSTGMKTEEQIEGGNVAGITAGVVVGFFALAALGIAATLYCWHKKKGLWTRDKKSLSKDDIIGANFEIEEEMSRKQKGSSVVGPELEFDLPAKHVSEAQRF